MVTHPGQGCRSREKQQTLYAYLKAVIAPVLIFRGQHKRPGISIPPYTTPHISPRTTVPASPGHGSNSLTRGRACQTDQGSVQLLEEQHQPSC